ncbi:MAG: DUF3179 domain-containing protein [Haloarculaceae archaeon]
MNVRDVLPRDAIPSVDDPTFGPEYRGDPEDRVLVLDADPPRAYPFRVLDFHEIVNDDLGRERGESDSGSGDRGSDPVAVTWCPLCGSAVVYDRRLDDRTLTFGVSGKLADDDLVLYDRETDSEWKQSTGECIAGELAGERLSVRRAMTLTWAGFRERHPEGVVLQPPETESEVASDDDTPAPVDYDSDPYREYRAGEGFGLAAHRGEDDRRAWTVDDLAPKTVVLGLEREGEALAFPLPAVRAAGGVVRATVGSTDAVVFEGDGELHAFADPGIEFEPEGREGGDGAVRGDGTLWDPATGEAGDDRRLARLPARRLYAFAWADDHGTDSFYAGEDG